MSTGTFTGVGVGPGVPNGVGCFGGPAKGDATPPDASFFTTFWWPHFGHCARTPRAVIKLSSMA